MGVENKENTPPGADNKVAHLNEVNNKHSTIPAGLRTLTVNQISPRQSLSIRVPKAKIDRSTQVTYQEIKNETGYSKPHEFVRRRKSIVRKPAIEIVTSSSSAEKSISLDNPPKILGAYAMEKAPPIVSVTSDSLDNVPKEPDDNRGVHRPIEQRRRERNQNGESQSQSPIFVYPELRRNSAPAMPQLHSPDHLAEPHR